MKGESESVTEANAIRTHGNRIRKIYQFWAILIAVAMISSALTLVAIGDGPSFPTIIEPGSLVDDAKYIIFQDGATYYAKNGMTGGIDDSDTNATSLIREVLSSGLTPGRTSPERITLLGDYVVYRITLPSNTTFDIRGSVTLADGADDHLFYSSSTTNVTICGGLIDGNKANQPETLLNCIIYFTNVNKFQIRDSHIVNGAYANIWLVTCSNGAVFENTLSGSTHNVVLLSGGSTIALRNNIVTEPGSESFDVRGGGVNILVTGNLINGDGNAGVICSQNYRTIISNNVMQDVTFGVYLDAGASGNIVTGNRIYDTSDAAILIRDSDENLVANNYLDNIWFNGITLNRANNNTISGNVIKDVCQYGDGSPYYSIFVTGTIPCENNTITENTFMHSLPNRPAFLIRVDATHKDTVIRFNDMVAGQSTGQKISNVGTRTVIEFNLGYTTENSGSITVTGAVSFITPSHGLILTPTIITITGNNSGIGWAVITTITLTQFVITFENQPGASIWKFYWYAEVR